MKINDTMDIVELGFGIGFLALFALGIIALVGLLFGAGRPSNEEILDCTSRGNSLEWCLEVK